jgi:hypothetical protein
MPPISTGIAFFSTKRIAPRHRAAPSIDVLLHRQHPPMMARSLDSMTAPAPPGTPAAASAARHAAEDDVRLQRFRRRAMVALPPSGRAMRCPP